jgi:hypothetical protein
MDFELGGLHAPDAACGEKPAQHKACPADIPEGPKDRHSRLDRHACPARRDRKTILIVVLTGFLQANPVPIPDQVASIALLGNALSLQIFDRLIRT